MTDQDAILTLPRPPAIPREEAPTGIPRTSSSVRLQALRDLPEKPEWLEALDELKVASEEREKRLMAAIATVAASGVEQATLASLTDHEQQEKIDELQRWKREVEDNAKAAAAASATAVTLSGNIATALDTLAAKWFTPQTISVAIGTMVTVGAGIVATYLKSRGLIP